MGGNVVWGYSNTGLQVYISLGCTFAEGAVDARLICGDLECSEHRACQGRLEEEVLQYVSRRVLAQIGLLITSTLVVFLLLHIAPGNPAVLLNGGHPPNAATIKSLDAKYALNRPLTTQYFLWISHLLRGNLGESIAARERGECAGAPLQRDALLDGLRCLDHGGVRYRDRTYQCRFQERGGRFHGYAGLTDTCRRTVVRDRSCVGSRIRNRARLVSSAGGWGRGKLFHEIGFSYASSNRIGIVLLGDCEPCYPCGRDCRAAE